MTRRTTDRLRGLGKTLRAFAGRRRFEEELDEELAFHVEMETAANVRAGMPPAAARRAALLAFGGVEKFREDVRDGRTVAWLEELRQNVALALRGARRAPAFAVAAVGTLAVGIGAATAIFGVVDAVVLRPLPFPDADRLVNVQETTPDGEAFSAAEPNFLDFRDGNRTLAQLAAYRNGEVSWTGAGEPARLHALWTSRNLLAALGVEPALGRGFTAGEDTPGGEGRVVLLGHALWQQRFGGDPAVLGRRVTFDGEPATVVGVLPAAAGLLRGDVWLPLAADPTADRDDHWLTLVGRLAPGASLETATTDLAAIASRIGASHPEVASWSVRVAPAADWLVDPRFRRTGTLLLAAVALLLLMACANVAGLLVARATARHTEIGVRVALGAGRARLLRQLLTESAVLAVAGGSLGIAGAAWVLRAARRLPPELAPRIDQAGLDGRVVLFALGAALLTSLLVGALPALTASRTDLHGTIRQTARAGGGTHRLREALVVGQLALAVMLLLGAGLMARSLLRLQRVDPGYATAAVWTVPVQLPESGYAEPWEKVLFYHRVVDRLRAIPGVTAAGGTSVTPLGGWNYVNDVTPAERAAEAPSSGYLQAAWRVVTPGYFTASGVPLLRGRDFSRTDRHEQPEVVIVSRELAERLWPGQDAVGKRLFWGGTEGEPKTVVGVAGDIRDFALDAEAQPMLFLPIGQIAWPSLTFVLRAHADVPGIADAVRRAVWEEDPRLPVPEVMPVAERRAAALAGRRLDTLLLVGFAAAALLLATVGVYGVLAYAVAQRRREIAVRMALGAEPRSVTGMLVRRGLRLATLGIAIGLAGALALGRLVEGLLFETSATDPLTLAAAPVALAAVAMLATLLPARRAARTEPMLALRQE